MTATLAEQGTTEQGTTEQGTTEQGTTEQGSTEQGSTGTAPAKAAPAARSTKRGKTGTAGRPAVPRSSGTDGSPATVRRQTTVATRLGEVTLVAQGDALAGVYFAEHSPAPDRSTFGVEVDADEDRTLRAAAEQLSEYVEGSREAFDLALAPVGSERARRVWELVAAVPRGSTTTYAALGREVGVGPRAAGQFVARNPLSVVVPCHRVVASDGRLTGYAGGVDRKRLLLQLEGALPEGATKVPRAPVATDDDAAEGGSKSSSEAAAGEASVPTPSREVG